MNIKLITRPIVEVVDDLSGDRPGLKDVFGRVRAVLKIYAAARGFKYSKLLLPHVYLDDGRLQRRIQKFIKKLPRPGKRTIERHEKYKEEADLNLRKLFKRLNNEEPKTTSHCFLTANLPAPLQPLIPVLPRENFTARSYSDPELRENDKARRFNHPLSENACLFLRAALTVYEHFGLASLESLLVHHAREIRHEIERIAPSAKWSSLHSTIKNIRKKLGLKGMKKKSTSMKVANFPPTLKEQWELFVKRSETGWQAEVEMIPGAERLGEYYHPKEKATMTCYRDALEISMGQIHYDPDLDVRDFFILKPVEVYINGVVTTQLRNPRIDAFRKIEWEKATDSKRRGYDSTLFGHFLAAIRAVALANGYGGLIPDFNRAYVVNFDSETRAKKKAVKKKVYSLEWLNQLIESLEKDFIAITDGKYFILDDPHLTIKERRKALRFCFFYVYLVSLRYLGFRQQCLRNCEVGRNIIFQTDGSIVLRWEADEVKNDKMLEAHLDPETHKHSHGKLINALSVYYEKIYKPLRKRKDEKTENQFFLKLNMRGEAVRFRSEENNDFHNAFTRYSLVFIELAEVRKELRWVMNPHHLRGLAADWYHDVLGAGIEGTAKALGDSRITIERAYLRNDQHVITPILDAVNQKIENNNQQIKLRNFIDDQHNSDEELYKATHRAEIAEARGDQLEERLGAALEQIASLQEQIAGNQRELIEVLKLPTANEVLKSPHSSADEPTS